MIRVERKAAVAVGQEGRRAGQSTAMRSTAEHSGPRPAAHRLSNRLSPEDEEAPPGISKGLLYLEIGARAEGLEPTTNGFGVRFTPFYGVLDGAVRLWSARGAAHRQCPS
jgi:hypothetical protein